jgi:hypothetical protein
MPLRFIVLSALAFVVSPASTLVADAQDQNENQSQMKEMTTAQGQFEVTMAPQSDAKFAVGRMTIEKSYRGVLLGTGVGQMLSVRTEVPGSAAYVAIEIFTGTVGGRSGTFAMQHVGTMNRGVAALSVTVVPDSGTGELKGLSGEMMIDQSDGKHSYVLSYSIAE